MNTRNANPLDRSPVHLLHRAYQAVDQVFAMGMQANSLTARQLAVLMTVEDNEGLSQTGIVNRTGVDRSTLADIVRRLTRKGLLQRRRTKEDAHALCREVDGRRPCVSPNRRAARQARRPARSRRAPRPLPRSVHDQPRLGR
jgi:DNA-binding MarR family transcriptional regulator